MDFNLILYGKDEFYNNINNKIYNILVINNIENENYMFNIVNNFNKGYIGIDLEFNHVSKEKIDVALMQLNLEDSSNIAHIFILNPAELTDENYINLIKLFTRDNLIKIVHGSESLDIPYLFKQFLISKENINSFCTNLYDTRYLCEYYKSDNNNISCGIYNLLTMLNIITNDKVKELEEIEEQMGPIWLIKINVYDLNILVLKYALYDVIYLPELLKKFLNFNNIYYTNIIPELTVLIYKYKKNMETQFLHLEKLMGKMNIYFILINNNKYLLQSIFNIYDELLFNDLKKINYFKNFLKIIIKLILYNNIYKKYVVYIKKNNTLNDINYNFFFNWLERYKYVNDLILEYNELIKDII